MNTHDKPQHDRQRSRGNYRWAAAGLAAGACLTLCCAGTVAIYARDVLIDPKVGDLGSTVQSALEKLVESKPPRIPGLVQNLGWYKASGTVTIKGAGGKDLSTTNPGWVVVPSVNNPGGHVALKVTANIAFNDDEHVSSHLSGWSFGVTPGVAWNQWMPVFIYAVNKDDSDAGLVFAFSRNPALGRTDPGAAVLGDKFDRPTTNSQLNTFIAADVKEADYATKPVALVGAATMKKVADAADWTFAASSSTEGFGQTAIRDKLRTTYVFPPGQNGALTQTGIATYLYVAGGDGKTDVPTWQNNQGNFVYTISAEGRVSITCDLTNSGYAANGDVASTVSLALPYASSKSQSQFWSSHFHYRIHGKSIVNGVFDLNTGQTIGSLNDSTKQAIVANDFASAVDYFIVSNLEYQAF